MSDDENNPVQFTEDHNEEAPQNWGLINDNSSSLSLNHEHCKSNDETLPKRSEKFFSQDGSMVQTLKLDHARDQMYIALSHIRGHHAKQILVGVWIKSQKKALVPHAKGNFFKDMGTPYVYKSKARLQGSWLTGIEAVYLCERGSLIMYLADEQFLDFMGNDSVSFDYDSLTRLTLSHLQSLAFASESELVDRYHVYALLKRLGYSVMQLEESHPLDNAIDMKYPLEIEDRSYFLSKIGMSFVSLGMKARKGFSSLLAKRDHFFDFTSVFKSITFSPPSTYFETHTPQTLDPIYRIVFHAWKPSPHFSKKAPPKPDFEIGVLNTARTDFPCLSSIQNTWLQSNKMCTQTNRENLKYQTEISNKNCMKPTKRNLKLKSRNERESKLDPKLRARNDYLRTKDRLLKTGSTGKSSIYAVVDNGIVNFVSFNETDFKLRSCADTLNKLERRDEHGIMWNEKLVI